MKVDDEVFVCPASPTQEGLWYIDQLDPGRSTYNIPAAFELKGAVDWPAFRAAVDELVTRHESLRTGFASTDGAPVQVISPTARVEVQHTSLIGRDDAEAELREQIQTEALTPFDLTTPPLLRVRTYTVTPSRHVIMFVFHHIIADGWSMGVFFHEFGQVYAAFAGGRPSPLTPIAIQYADFSIWHSERLTPELTENQLAYWREALRSAPDALELPTDHPRPPRSSNRGDTTWFTIGADATRRLRELCRTERSTTFMAVVALIDLLIARHTGEYDIVLGTPMAGRVRQELEGTVGFFANALALRTTLAPDISFRQALQRVRAATIGAYEHADLPFRQVVAAARPDRTSAANPLFQVMCAFQTQPNELLELPSIEVRPIDLCTRTAKFDLLFEFRERADRIEGSLEFSTDLFESATIDRWISRFLSLVDAAGSLPDTAIAKLPILPDDERRQIENWNRTAVAHAGGPTVVDAFERQVTARPDAPAVQFGETTLSYRELNRRANRLARLLQGKGVRQGERVGICMERSVDLYVAVLATLKAGGAYLPMDPAYPRDRLAFMAEDGDVKVLLSDGSETPRALPDRSRVIEIAECWTAAQDLSDENLSVPLSARDGCFVMYTSGSTGQPKGVAMPHGPLFNLIAWQLTRSAPRLKTWQYSAISFDVSFQETFSTWAEGGHLVIVPESTRRDAEALLDFIRRQGIERIFLPFVALQLLAETAVAGGRSQTSLREMFTAGEQLRMTPAIRAFFESMPGVTLDNHYGPTEAHVVTAHRLTGSAATWPELPPIGTPIANTRIHLLDASMQPVPIGVVGDLWIAGSCLADGYWRRPDLTAERFVEVEIESGSPSVGSLDRPKAVRMYRSGDRARYAADGAIEFLGRSDHQVKIRGYRIEPAEIEAMLEKHPALKQVAVMPYQGGGGLALAAYYVKSGDVSPTPTDLRDFLKGLVPEYMVPSAFVALEKFPTTPSGKLDRKALPAPVIQSVSTSDTPLTETESALAAIWCKLLGVDAVHAADDFFGLGGHSLLAMKLVHEVDRCFSVHLTPGALLEATTLGGLARRIDQARENAASVGAAQRVMVQLERGGAGTPFFWVHGLGGEVYSYMQMSRRLGVARPVYGFAADWTQIADSGPMDLAAMAARYVQEMRTVQTRGPYHLGGFCSAVLLAYEMARQIEAAGERVGVLAVLDYNLSHPKSGSMLRTVRAFASNLPRWIREDAIPSGGRELLGRVRSRLRRVVGHLKYRSGSSASPAIDLRDELGMWRFPEFQLPMLRAYREASLRYEFKPIRGRVALFLARTAPLLGPWPNTAQNDWRALAGGGLEVHVVPGSHATMMKEPFLEEMVTILARRVAEADEAKALASKA
jgi:amino acid adenylation domain-containing protein